ncbi:MAG TPA: sulfotransferase [Gaiellaceae bacterium]|nr:sulfotransferase [Gaiellaceae bacterium]
MSRPLFVLGVSRSGTTLLRVILDRSPGIAIPDETFFVPQLAHRHRSPVDPAQLLDDLRRLPRLAAWGVSADDLASRLEPGMSIGEALDAVFSTYAAKHGKPRWGDKTPMYMRHLGLIERLFPDAQYLHLIRDGRDAALAFLDMPEGVVTKTWAHPRDARGFACEWSTEVRRARALGQRLGPSRYLEIRYEDLVADTAGVVRSACAFAAIPFDTSMLAYSEAVDVSEKPHHQRLLQPPTRGVRDWRAQMSEPDVLAFEAIAGDLLGDLGYELRGPAREGPGAGARASLASYRARMGAWNTASRALQRSPLWRRRHPRLF